MINEIATYIIPIFILLIIVTAIIEKLDVFTLFVDGVNDGLKVIIKIFPSILAITIAVNLLTETNALKFLLTPISNIITLVKVPEAIIPLVILRPLSGSASTAMVLEIFANFGPDSIEGIISSIIMSSSETTFYVLAVLFGSVGIKKHGKVTFAAIVADIVAVTLTILWANTMVVR